MFAMSEYPKYFSKGDVTKTAHNRRQEVELKFAGYKQADFKVEATTEEPPARHAELVERVLPDAADTSDETTTEEAAWETNGGASKPTQKKR